MEKTEFKTDGCTLEIIRGDITKQDTDAIVNAANKQLAPGGGVAGAIHKAAGPGLWEECKKLGGCETGEAKITSGHKLSARFVIHTVGPVYNNTPQNAIDLENCYLNSLLLSVKHDLKSISFPAISIGIFGYPLKEAAELSLKAVIKFLEKQGEPELVRFVLFSENDLAVFKKSLQELVKNR